MAHPEHLAVLKQGVDAWNKWRLALYQDSPFRRPDLAEANLAGVFLNGIDLAGANLRRCDLRGASLLDADFQGAYLEEAQLGGTILVAARFRREWEIRLKAGMIAHSKDSLDAALTYGPNLAGSSFAGTTIDDIDLRCWSGLEQVKHHGPSVITTRTLVKSKGQIPSAFLRGCGLPDQLIEYLPSLLNSAIGFHSCFISYSTRDQDFANRLHADLQSKGVRCWFAPHNVRGGKKLHEQIDEAIRMYDRLLLVLSEHSMESEWVKTEIAHARQKEQAESRQVLFPLTLVPFSRISEWKCFDADIGRDSAREIREYFIPDFSNWKNHDAYKAAFERLVRDLKSEEGTAQAAEA